MRRQRCSSGFFNTIKHKARYDIHVGILRMHEISSFAHVRTSCCFSLLFSVTMWPQFKHCHAHFERLSGEFLEVARALKYIDELLERDHQPRVCFHRCLSIIFYYSSSTNFAGVLGSARSRRRSIAVASLSVASSKHRRLLGATRLRM